MNNIIKIAIAVSVSAISMNIFSQWFILNTGTAQNLNEICFIDSSTGIAAGNNGIIIRTTNSGNNWSIISQGLNSNLISMKFPSSLTGYIGSISGTVLKSSTGGSSWNILNGCSSGKYLSFLNSTTGITGTGSLMCYTTDGGLSWSSRNLSWSSISGLAFIESTSIISIVNSYSYSFIFKSTNTGNNWIEVRRFTNNQPQYWYTLNYIYFRDQFTGFITAGYTKPNGDHESYIYKTYDSGNNWSLVYFDAVHTNISLGGIHFGDANTGFAVGSTIVGGPSGCILKSTDGGNVWQYVDANYKLSSVFMINSLTGYICCQSGYIMKTTNGGGISGIKNVNNNIPDDFSLYQNYPNPFNPTTKIKFDIPSLVRRGAGVVVLKVYDVLGREIITLVNEQLSPGTYEVEFDGTNYPSGIYYYKLITENYTETRKMVLIK